MSIGKKLALSFGVMMALSAALAYASFYSVRAIQQRLDIAINMTARQIDLVQEVDKAILRMRNGQRGVVLYSLLKQPERAATGRRQFEDAAREIARLMREYRPTLRTAEARQAAEVVDSGVKAWLPLFERIAGLCAREQLDGELYAVVDQTFGIADPSARAAAQLLRFAGAQNGDAKREAAATVARQQWLAAGLFLLYLGAVAAILFVLRGVHTTLTGLANQVGNSAEQVKLAAADAAVSSQSVSRGAADQAASLEQTSASGEEISSMTRRNAENAISASRNVAEVTARIQTAEAEVNAMLQSMNEITTSSGKISQIIRVIDEIAFQTNILALNAAVEAARAGEAGQGFAVVADEVRNLAQRSAQAARDTATLIEQSIASSNEGKLRLDQVVAAMHAIAASTSSASELVEEVRAGGQEQASAVEQISQTLGHMAEVTQQTAAGAEQSAAASEGMAAQARVLNDAVLQLRMLIGSGGRAISVEEQVRMAIGAHEAWKDRLLKAIETRQTDVDVEKARRHDACTFGKWLQCGSAGQSAAVKKVCEFHRQFHSLAAGILEDALAGRSDKARQALSADGEFARVSDSLKAALLKL